MRSWPGCCQKKDSKPEDRTDQSPSITVISRTGLALLVFIGLAGAFPSAVNWGAHFWGFLPLPVPLLLGALMAMALLPAVQDRFLALLTRAVATFSIQAPSRRRLLWIVICAALGLLLWSFRQRTFFLGDGYLVLRTLPVEVASGDLPASFPTAPLTGYLAAALFGLFRVVGAADPALYAWQSLSVFSGIFALPASWWLVRPLAADTRERLALTALVYAGGAMMLFFGYVETYAPAYAVMIAFVAAAQDVRVRDGSLTTLLVLFVVLVFLHIGMAVFGVLVLYVCVRVIRARGWKALVLPVLAAIATTAIALVLISYSPQRLIATLLRDGASFLPLGRPDGWNESYTLFSLWHWVDLLNLHIMVAPFSLVLAGGLFASVFLPARYRQREAFFWVALAGPAFLWLFVNNFELGMSRDWDLAAPFATVVGWGGLASWLAMMGPSDTRTRGVVLMAMITIAHTAGWVGVNASAGGSLLRYDALLDFRSIPPRAMAIAYEEVGDYRRARGDLSGAAEAFARCVALDSTNARRWTVLGNAQAMQGNAPGARKAYERAIALGSADHEVRMNLGIMLFRQGDVDAAVRRLQEAVALDSADANAACTLGQMLVEGKGDVRGALPWFERALRLDPENRRARAYADRCRPASGPSSKPE